MPDDTLYCATCKKERTRSELASTLLVCPDCGHHFRMEPYERIATVADPGSFVEFDHDAPLKDPIGMVGYRERLAEAVKSTGLPEAVITGSCAIEGNPAIVAAMSFSFIGGSMGSVAGQKITRAMLEGVERRVPVIAFAASGGVRMQEGIHSLMQMVKTSSAAWRLDREGIPLFIVLCDPSSGGVIASFAMLGDVIIAEPGAFVGFAGPRVIEKTINRGMPEGLQRAERQLDRGFVDIIAPRGEHRELLARLMRTHPVRSIRPTREKRRGEKR
ncbi:MAG TPA: acetyl-CoA carboxylase carboxyltransferase subunit beta [Treponemataceae bacterium]|nr:acetyl-CoA carboxylase carboxyltransferase subunit beta [Treponemataceae bacterium]